MSNIIQIKRGANAPGSGDLYPYELGYNTANNCLYIGTENGSATAIKALTADSATTAGSISGVTASKTEINYLKGVTSAIQTQLNGKSDSGHTHSSILDSGDGSATTLAYSKTALGSASWIAGWNGYELRAIQPAKVISSAGITATVAELNYCDGVTSNIQTQLDGKAASSHGTHVSYGTSAKALGTSSAGSATTVSRSDHVHALPALTSCTGTLTVAKGGTGATTAAAARTKLGISMIEIKTVSSLAHAAESALTFSRAVQCVAVITKRVSDTTMRCNTNFWTPAESGYGSNFYALYQIDSYRSFVTFSNSNKTVTIKNDSETTLDYTVIAFLTP